MGCNRISKEEMDHVEMTKKKDCFQHKWLVQEGGMLLSPNWYQVACLC